MFWPFSARNRTCSGKHVEHVAVPEPLKIPERVPELGEWKIPQGPPKEIPDAEHVRIVIKSFQASGRTGFVPGYVIHRVYPELAWAEHVEPLTRRQLDIALSANLRKAKQRTELGRRLLVHYEIPEARLPRKQAAPKVAQNIVAFASRATRPPARPALAPQARHHRGSAKKGERKAKAA